MIRRQGGKYVLLAKSTGRVLGRHEKLADARQQERAIQIAKHMNQRGTR